MNKRMTRYLPALALLALFGTSCRALRPDGSEPLAGYVPDTFSLAGESAAPSGRWWVALGSPELDMLIERAFAANLTLAQAQARLRQSRALAAQAGAAAGPTLALNAGAAHTRNRADTAADGVTTRNTDQYDLGVAASYELDLWGRLRSAASSAQAAVAASRFDIETAAVSLAAQVAETWARILEQRVLLDLLREQLETSRTVLELLEVRQRRGAAAGLDVYQQQANLAAIESLVPRIESTLAAFEHQLAVLLGLPPGSAPVLSAAGLPQPAALPAPGLPADVLAQRPDVRAAFYRFDAAGWNVAAARADRLPALRLTGTATYRSEELNTLFDNWLLNLAGNLALPLLDAGRRKAEVTRTLAVTDERLAQYRATVLNALREVEDALVADRKQRERLARLETQLDFARRALDEAAARYRKGLNDYLRVLTALTSLQNLQREVIAARRETVSNRISLHRALGGRWMQEAIDKEHAVP